MQIVSCLVSDGRGRLPVVWFNQPWIVARLQTGVDLYLYGPVRRNQTGTLQLVNPEVVDLLGRLVIILR